MYQFFIISLASAEESKISESEMCIYVYISTYQVVWEQEEGEVGGEITVQVYQVTSTGLYFTSSGPQTGLGSRRST